MIEAIRSSLFYRLYLLTFLPLLGLTLITFFVSSNLIGQKNQTLYDNTLIATAHNIANRLSTRDGKIRLNMDYFSIDTLSTARQEKVFYRIVTENGVELAGFRGLTLAPANNKNEKKTTFYDTVYAGTSLKAVQLRTSTSLGGVNIVVAESQQGRNSLMNDIRLTLSVVALFLCTSAGIFCFVAIKKGLAPLTKLRTELSKKSDAQLNKIITNVPTELQDLVAELNRLICQLDKVLKESRSFNADLAHQLRTPLSEIKTHLLTLSNDSHQNPMENRRICVIDKINNRVNYMTRTIKQLLTYNQVKHQQNSQRQDAMTNLTELCQSVASQLAPNIYTKKQEIEFIAPEPPILRKVNPTLLEGALVNLIENASKYMPEKTCTFQPLIIIKIEEEADKTVSIHIIDNGLGVPEDKIALLTQRHVRLDQNTIGSGIGLAIVEQICEYHKANLSITNRSSSGLDVCLHGFTSK